MKKHYLLFLIVLIGLVFLTISATWLGTDQMNKTTKKTDLYVLSAASLTEVMKEQERQFESTHPTINLVISYASSGKLQKQIEQGTPADLFLSAGIKQMNALETKNIIQDSTKLLKNDIVLISSKGSSMIKDVNDLSLPKVKSIAIGYPDTVPAGKYTKQTLRAMGLWKKLESKFVYANDVRQVVNYVETGNVEAGFVYKTDITKSPQNTNLVQKIDTQWHDSFQYPAGILAGTENLSASQTFFDWLQSNTAKQIFETYGFQMND